MKQTKSNLVYVLNARPKFKSLRRRNYSLVEWNDPVHFSFPLTGRHHQLLTLNLEHLII